MNRCKTPLRYPGGKSKATKKLFQHFPPLENYNDYREPFLGGGSVAIAVTKQRPDINVWVNDLYWPLYNFWIHLRDRGDELSDDLYQLKVENNVEDKARILFNHSRDILKGDNDPFVMAKAFWIVNKCSFSGLTEKSTFSAGPSNSNFSLNGIENLKYYSSIIKKWKITNVSYENLFEPVERGFIYLDPPYEISSALYGREGSMHKGFDHDLFAKHCGDHIHQFDMAISYNDNDSVKTRFPNWKHIVFPLTYSLRADSKNYRKDQPNRNELLLINY